MRFRLRNVVAMVRKEGRTMLPDHALLAAILAQPARALDRVRPVAVTHLAAAHS